LIISGGPHSVCDPGSPQVDPAIFAAGYPVLGICYGQQLMARVLGGTVRKSENGEFGLATLNVLHPGKLFAGIESSQQIWMSHRDSVEALPPGFSAIGATATCEVAAIEEPILGLYGVQFHPEVVHTTQGRRLLANFVFDICGCVKDWDPKHRGPTVEDAIRATVRDRNVFFFVSGGVDSTVAYTLCRRALGNERVRGVYVDTGLMREGETEFVRQMFGDSVEIQSAAEQFLTPLAGVCDPEEKRRIIGEQFVRVQERIIESRHLLDGNWILGQGTIYPDTIESGGTQKAALIKTHHNRVPGIQKLLDRGRVVEPLSSFYKDEVREIGRELGLPGEFLDRHPFPGPGLAIRCLCSETELPLTRVAEGYVVPIRSVGVQGDSRSYAPVLALDRYSTDLRREATELVNRTPGINRVIARVDSRAPLSEMRVRASGLTPERVERLRRADAAVRTISRESGFDNKIWQFPVVLIPLGTEESPDSVVLRPIDSQDGMTAESVEMDDDILLRITSELLAMRGVCGAFYDLTNKPPATIEWE
ncbi:MAG: glutamine-hydrolyzing GMP synthase, partial [Acidobacteriota bacterium]|nr:glutamine-hydrolyzing GMP synthase [Acidobacteriota bacterium]